MAEDLTDYYRELGLRVEYLHSEIDTLERIRIVRDLRAARFDILIGINLLREGLDIPEVSLVAVLDADKEGYLRSETSLVQIFGQGREKCFRQGDSLRGHVNRIDARRHGGNPEKKKYPDGIQHGEQYSSEKHRKEHNRRAGFHIRVRLPQDFRYG